MPKKHSRIEWFNENSPHYRFRFQGILSAVQFTIFSHHLKMREKKKPFDPQTLIQSLETTFSTLICISSCEFWICFGFGVSLLSLTNSSHLAYLVLKNRILNVFGILCTLFKMNYLFSMHNIVCDYEFRFDDFLVAILVCML